MSAAARLPTPTTTRWQLLRAGIQNVWEYDDHRFVFHRGRLLLRGQNESGKTKALEVLLPFLLDANLQPQRLDPFGSNARPMRWNLISDRNPEVNLNIGYVWLELGRLDDGAPTFWTIGAGLKARRATTTVEDWYFGTSRRVDVDLALYDEARVPLPRGRLVEALGGRGEVFERGGDYRRALNERLFGLAGDQYAALVDALLQLRRPQLSKQLDPTELSRILTASLPPLDAGVIGVLAEGFERLDRHRAEREAAAAVLGELRGFLAVYRGYVAGFVKARALELTRADSGFHAARAALRAAEERLATIEARIAELAAAAVAQETEGHELSARLEALKASEAYRAVEALDEAEAEAGRAARAAAGLRAAADELDAQLAGARRRLAEAEGEADREGAARVDALDLASARARAAGLEVEHGAVAAALEAPPAAEGLGAVAAALEAPPAAEGLGAAGAGFERAIAGTAGVALAAVLGLRRDAIAALRRLERRVRAAEDAVEKATDRLALAVEATRVAEERLGEAEAREARARQDLLVAIEAWAAACRVLPVDPVALLELAPEAMRSSLEPGAAAVRAALDEVGAAASLALRETERTIAEVASERAALAAARHREPAAPAWRSSRGERPGAPLYLLCDFRAELDPVDRGALEAALEASGLLDAWITPDGEILAADTFDAALVVSPEGEAAVAGATLADALAPVDAAAVPAEVVDRVLQTIGLIAAGARGTGPAWIALDGRFALGPLIGAYRKAEAELVGAGARERARQRRLAELDVRLAELELERGARAGDVEEVRGRRARLEGELAGFPDLAALVGCQLAARARGEEVAAARRTVGDSTARVREREGERAELVAARDAVAAERGLRGWVERLDDLERRTFDYERAAQAALDAAGRAERARRRAHERGQEVAGAEPAAARSAATASDADADAARAAARARALREAAGSTREEILGAIRTLEERRRALAREVRATREADSVAKRQSGEDRVSHAAADLDVAGRDVARKEAEARVREVARQGMFELAGVDLERGEEAWSYTDALQAARRADEATARIDSSEAARDRAWNKVSERHQDLMRALRPEMRVLAEQASGLTIYRATFNGRPLALLELAAELEADVAARDRLLGDDERGLFESFLSGEAHEHLRERLREANALIRRMNQHLEDHPTSSGMAMRLQWVVDDAAAPGTQAAIQLLFKSGSFLSDADRATLGGFLRERLDQARAATGARSLAEQLLTVLDYRAWHGFHVECRTGAEGWRRLTRKVHAAGSGGQKAVMLHLPLFAAAAAFYDSARADAPRLILLDEAFAGIDRETRGQLMGLLADFDLDFVMTSYEEWGFFPELDGLSTYHLAREKGMPGVYTDWFVWDGREAIQVPA